MRLLISWIVLIGGLIPAQDQTGGSEVRLLLENPRIAVEIDRQTGALRSIRDKQQGLVYPQSGIGFEVVTTEQTLRSEKASAVSTEADLVELRFTGSGVGVGSSARKLSLQSRTPS